MKRVRLAAAILSAEGCQSGFSMHLSFDTPRSYRRSGPREHFQRAKRPLAGASPRPTVSRKRGYDQRRRRPMMNRRSFLATTAAASAAAVMKPAAAEELPL